MSINEVIKLGEEVPTIWETSNFLSIWAAFALIICFMLVGIGINLIKNSVILEGVLFILVGLFAVVFLSGIPAEKEYLIKKAEYMENWKQEVVSPFIEDLPEEKHLELVQFVEKIPTSEWRSSNVLASKITSTELLEGTEYGELKYIVDGKEKTERGWFIIEFVQEGEPAYLYKEVKKDLNEEYEKGAYNKTIVVPLDKYSFEGTAVIYFNKK